jgi:hypothetical protein
MMTSRQLHPLARREKRSQNATSFEPAFELEKRLLMVASAHSPPHWLGPTFMGSGDAGRRLGSAVTHSPENEIVPML